MGARKRPAWMPNPETIFEDLAALAAQTRRRGDPMPQWRLDRLRAGREKAKADRKRAALQRALARRRERIRSKRARTPIRWRYLLAMLPGRWYGFKSIGRAVGQPPNTSSAVRLTLERAGLIERTANPKWDGEAVVTPIMVMSGVVREPQWLYRLTSEGEKKRAELSLPRTPARQADST